MVVEGCREALFTGQITAVEFDYSTSGGYRVFVRGYDLLHQLRKRQPVRAHVQMNLLELARTLVDRITSYNVCYTKLLRGSIPGSWFASAPSTAE